MKGLFVKDLKLMMLQKNFLLLILAIVIGMMIFTDDVIFPLGFLSFIVSLFTVSTISYDDFDNGNAFLFTLPITRNHYVSEKYFLGLLLGCMAWVLATVLGIITTVLKDTLPITDLVQSSLMILPIMIVVQAIMLPFQLKFGGDKGRIAMIGAFGVLAVISIVIVKGAEAIFNVDLVSLVDNLRTISMGVLITIIIIIALFYSGHIAYQPLLISLALLALLYAGGKMRVNNNLFYYIVGFFVWILFLESGIHPTIAGVLVAFTVPARPKINLNDFTCDMTGYLNMLDYTEVRQSKKAAVLTPTQIQVLNNIHSLADRTISPLQSIADKLHPMVNYLILPLFAFVNAGVTFGDIQPASLVNVPLAVFLGLFVGKTLGIFSFTYFFARTSLASMPAGMTRWNLFGVSMLGGIGFTVALFIANLSFNTTDAVGMDLLNQAKLGVFTGSFVSGLCGYLLLKKVLPKAANE